MFELHYYAVRDIYETSGASKSDISTKMGWQSGADGVEGGIFRKVEDDWKMVYLARKAGSVEGKVTWTLEVSNPKRQIDSIALNATTATFHNGTIEWMLRGWTENSEEKTILVRDPKNFETRDFRGIKKFSFSATLKKGKGSEAWQHAQLFRQSLSSNESSMTIRVTTIENSNN